MSNRKKAKKPWLGDARNKARTLINGSGLARNMEEITIPEEAEVQVIKEVPAVVTHPETGEKATVGTAYIHDDASVGIRYDKDAPQWALDLVVSTAAEVGYSLGPLFEEE